MEAKLIIITKETINFFILITSFLFFTIYIINFTIGTIVFRADAVRDRNKT
jgi:hypothetical protein